MKTFSLEEAQSMLPVLESLLCRAMDAKATADQREEELQQLSQRIFFAGGMMVDLARTGRQRAEQQTAIQQTKDALEEIQAIGVQVKDLESGLLDFPCQLGEDIVLLCWKMGEERITHWHTLDAGFQGRQPLDSRFLKKQPPPN
ncbi:MAG TPA: DUF2203 domain-containing protein [Acidobacteriaceae bacterium]|jgi:hypothetical protein|nr:DUF2203 domain-containing protein [Acidobacteriaceae bacterium]